MNTCSKKLVRNSIKTAFFMALFFLFVLAGCGKEKSSKEGAAPDTGGKSGGGASVQTEKGANAGTSAGAPGQQGGGGKGKETVPVEAVDAVEKSIPEELNVIGFVQAYETINVKSQVGGELVEVLFKEGQDVKKGDVLFKIDSRSYDLDVKKAKADLEKDQSQIKQAEANLAKSKTLALNAENTMKRYETLSKNNVVSTDEYDKVKTQYESYLADVRADEAALENTRNTANVTKASLEDARLQLSYCTIKSPINGRTGSLMVNRGNIVKANDQILVTINQLSPIYVTFSLPEKNLARIKQIFQSGKIKTRALIQDDTGTPPEGEVVFIENEVNTQTGTITIKALFENTDYRLWPGQYVNINMLLSVTEKAVVVPERAVQKGQVGYYVYVLSPDMKAELRQVEPGITYKAETIIKNGITAGEKVVTDGHLRLVPGASAKIKGAQNESTGNKK